MLLLILLSMLGVFAFFLASPHPENVILRRFISLGPLLILVALLFPWTLSDTVIVHWRPESLFPDPVFFRTTALAKTFCVYLTVLWLLSEIIGGIRKSNSSSSRIFSIFFLGGGFLCFFAANALSILLSWILLDVLTFFLFLFLDVQQAEQEHRSTALLSKSFGLLFINLLSNILIIIPALLGPQATQLDWSSVWANPPTSFGLICFIVGVFLRLFLFPFLFSSSRFSSGFLQIDILLRLLYPATVLSLLSIAWPAAYLQPNTGSYYWAVITMATLIFFSASIVSFFSPVRRAIRDMYPLCVSSLAVMVATQTPQSSIIFQGSAAILLIGGGIVFLVTPSKYSRALSLFVYLPVVFFVSGFPFTPSEAVGSFFLTSIQEGDVFLLLPSTIGLVAFSASVIRLHSVAINKQNDSPRPIFWVSIIIVFLASIFILYPGYHVRPLAVPVFLVPAFLFALAVMVGIFFPKIDFRPSPSIQPPNPGLAEQSLFENIRRFCKRIFQFFEGVFDGEGSLIWSFCIILLIWLVFTGK